MAGDSGGEMKSGEGELEGGGEATPDRFQHFSSARQQLSPPDWYDSFPLTR